jgi:hypothetical protein
MSNVQEVWWRPGGRSPFALDPTKPRLPQIGSMVGQFVIILGGPAIAGYVRLVLGQGRLGLEWLKSIELIER